MGIWNNRKNKQAVINITAKGIAEHFKLDVGTLSIASPDTFEAWELDYNQQARNARTGEYTQFVSSLNKRPIKIFSNRPQSQSQSTKSMAAQQFDEKLVQIEKVNQRQSMLLWLGIFILALALMTGLIVLLNMGG